MHPPTYIPIMDEALLYFPRLCVTHKFNCESLAPIRRSVRDLFGHLVVAEALVQKHITPISLFDTVTTHKAGRVDDFIWNLLALFFQA